MRISASVSIIPSVQDAEHKAQVGYRVCHDIPDQKHRVWVGLFGRLDLGYLYQLTMAESERLFRSKSLNSCRIVIFLGILGRGVIHQNYMYPFWMILAIIDDIYIYIYPSLV